MPDQNSYEIGYMKPPKKTQWKPGQSGNPNGRPKKIKDFEKLLDIELSKEITITEGGQEVRMSKREVLLKSLINDALKGDLRATKMVLPFMVNQQSVPGFEPDAADKKAFEQLLKTYEQCGHVPDSEASDDQL
jgi:hypothetical protein